MNSETLIKLCSGSMLFNWNLNHDLLSGKLELDPPPIRILKQLIDPENEELW